jgi:hypothetical protein
LSAWTAGEPLQQPCFGHVAVSVDDTDEDDVYLVGGRFGPDSEALDDVEVFDGEGETSPRPAMNDPRGGAAAVVLTDNSILAVGGFAGSLADEVSATQRCETCSPSLATWLDTTGLLSQPVCSVRRTWCAASAC